jgi:hypothetical protein
VLAWADSSKATGWIKKIPATPRVCTIPFTSLMWDRY